MSVAFDPLLTFCLRCSGVQRDYCRIKFTLSFLFSPLNYLWKVFSVFLPFIQTTFNFFSKPSDYWIWYRWLPLNIFFCFTFFFTLIEVTKWISFLKAYLCWMMYFHLLDLPFFNAGAHPRVDWMPPFPVFVCQISPSSSMPASNYFASEIIADFVSLVNNYYKTLYNIIYGYMHIYSAISYWRGELLWIMERHYSTHLVNVLVETNSIFP